MTWGQSYMHFASSTSASAQITHGLGVAPVFMAAVPYEGGGVYFYYNVGVASHADPTNYFWVKGWSDSGVAATTNDLYFYWLAIG